MTSRPEQAEGAARGSQQKRYLLFDIRGSVKPKDVSMLFDSLKLGGHEEKKKDIYRFRSYDGRRYVAVTKYPADPWDVKPLKADSVTVHTVERFGDYINRLEGRDEILPPFLLLPDKDLLMVEYTVLGQGLTTQQFKNDMIGLKSDFKTVGKLQETFHLTAKFPVKLVVFRCIEDYELDGIYLEGTREWGGPYQIKTEVTPMQNF